MKNVSTKILCLCRILVIGAILSGCAHSIHTKSTTTYKSLNYNEKVYIYGLNDPLPETYEVLGEVRLGDTGFSTDCSYEKAVELAEAEARKIGGNAVKITKHTLPDLWSTCHRVSAILLKVDPASTTMASTANQEEIPDAEDYALLYLYRPNGMGMAVNYDVKLDDSIVFRARNNSKKIVKIKKEGTLTLSGATETVETLPLDVRFGKIYYVKASVGMGIMVGRPVFDLVQGASGKAEFQAVKWKKSDIRDVIVLATGVEMECIITGSDEENIYFTVIENGIKTKKSEKKALIKSIERNNNK